MSDRNDKLADQPEPAKHTPGSRWVLSANIGPVRLPDGRVQVVIEVGSNHCIEVLCESLDEARLISRAYLLPGFAEAVRMLFRTLPTPHYADEQAAQRRLKAVLNAYDEAVSK